MIRLPESAQKRLSASDQELIALLRATGALDERSSRSVRRHELARARAALGSTPRTVSEALELLAARDPGGRAYRARRDNHVIESSATLGLHRSGPRRR